ncbi:hypothetical protein B0I31_10946 [Saccharothrix carnea]|uniref:Guanylate cyclase domain-containing protein n=1 Tax=Saccharothrix carnea TaxID=1280637 RepID=A0A2P8I459_SACCR|nr:hypothetical protein [Saccharothrix carnea]PSL53256.1 hypothetical protein B0I31_10946 [Saccharothrix carnea]
MENPSRYTASVSIGGNAHGPVAAGRDITITSNGEVDPRQESPVGDLSAVHRVVVNTDIQGSGRHDNAGQRHLRRVLAESLAAGAAELGPQADMADRGDGMLVVLPETVTVVDTLDTFVEAAARAVREHNRAASADYRVDMRIAVHAGFVDRVGAQWSGAPLVHAARLVDAADAKRALATAAESCVALVLSEVAMQVVDQGYSRVGPSAYRQIPLSVKETSGRGWLRLL